VVPLYGHGSSRTAVSVRCTYSYGTFGMQRLIFSAKYRVLVRGGWSRPKIRSGIRIRAQKQAESSR
jgi:hypothetical protein